MHPFVSLSLSLFFFFLFSSRTNLQGFDKVLMIPWGHEPQIFPTSGFLYNLNDLLTTSPVLVQGFFTARGEDSETCTVDVAFPIEDGEGVDGAGGQKAGACCVV
jgi:hypothetical protein